MDKMIADALRELAKQIGRQADAAFRQAKSGERLAIVAEKNYETQKQLAKSSEQLEKMLVMAQGEAYGQRN